jgi:hypothetical protein
VFLGAGLCILGRIGTDLGHGKKRSFGVWQLALGFKSGTATSKKVYTATSKIDLPLDLKGFKPLQAHLSSFISLLGYL